MYIYSHTLPGLAMQEKLQPNPLPYLAMTLFWRTLLSIFLWQKHPLEIFIRSHHAISLAVTLQFKSWRDVRAKIMLAHPQKCCSQLPDSPAQCPGCFCFSVRVREAVTDWQRGHYFDINIVQWIQWPLLKPEFYVQFP